MNTTTDVQDPGLFGDLHPTNYFDDTIVERYSVWALAYVTGISKSQVSLALQRCIDVGLAFDLFDNIILDTH